uniref:BTB domain-containing protein n=1 Tax=Angiostrongylus cantonensis TaxID=6313 RepID=A0A158P9D2_ANGCA
MSVNDDDSVDVTVHCDMVAMKVRDVPNRLVIGPEEPAGMDCFADDRDALNDFAKYYNNAHLSDVNIIVGDENFAAHRLILAKSSEVFDRMLSQRWNGERKVDLEIVEDAPCQKVFPAFLRFLYCNHVVLHQDNCLPILILADKYNVISLKKVCIDFAISEILPSLTLKDVFSIWFSYATKAYHQLLIRACIQAIARDFELLITEEWEKSWLALDRDQMIEILKCNQLVIANEYRLWEAVMRWLQAPNHPERRGTTASPLLSSLLPYIRFPFMTADELTHVERSQFAECYPKLFHPQILLAYKFQALPLSSRVNCKEFLTTQFLLRNYTDIRWDKRISISNEQLYQRGVDHSFQIRTRSCTFPLQTWQWTLKLGGSSYSNAVDDVLKAYLISEDIDQPSRSIEYMLSIVDEKRVLRSFSSKKNFTKTRYSSELDIDRKVEINDLLTEDSPLLVNGELHLQITLRPID